MRLSRNAVKLDIRDRGLKLTEFEAKEITRLAEQRWQEFVGQATTNLLRWSEETEQGPEINGFGCAEFMLKSGGMTWRR
jgi:hypothetical protein